MYVKDWEAIHFIGITWPSLPGATLLSQMYISHIIWKIIVIVSYIRQYVLRATLVSSVMRLCPSV